MNNVKNVAAGLFAFAVVVAGASAAQAGAISTVENNLKIETGRIDTDVTVNTDFERNGWDKYENVATKVDYINEHVTLPDGLGTKDIYTEITAVSTSSGMSDFSESSHTSVDQSSHIDVLLDQTVSGSAGVSYQ